MTTPLSKVYFIQAEEGLIKIGYSADVQARLKQLSAQRKEHLVLLAEVPGGKWTESKLHELLESERVDGEWFKGSARVLELAALVIGSLPPEHSSFSIKELRWLAESIGLTYPTSACPEMFCSLRVRVQYLRKHVNDLSMRELDRIACICRNSTFKIESGENDNPSIDTVACIQAVFNVSADWLINGRGLPPEPEHIAIGVAAARERYARRQLSAEEQ